ncbi:hypothetical protein [Myxosarcina sp. GI1(2024)]
MLSAELFSELDKNTEKLFSLLDRTECDIASGTCEITVGNFRKLKKYLKNLKRVLANARVSVLNNRDVTEDIRFEALVRLDIIVRQLTFSTYCLSGILFNS